MHSGDDPIARLRASARSAPDVHVDPAAVWTRIRRRKSVRSAFTATGLVGAVAALSLMFTSSPWGDSGERALPGTHVESPLATYSSNNQDLADGALLIGTLSAEDGCVYVRDRSGHRYILALPSESAEWIRGALVFEDGPTILNGESVSVSGGASSTRERLAVPEACDPFAAVWRGTVVVVVP